MKLSYMISERVRRLRDSGIVPTRIMISIPSYYVLKMERALSSWGWTGRAESFLGLPVEVFGLSPVNTPTPFESLESDEAAKSVHILGVCAGRHESFCVGADE